MTMGISVKDQSEFDKLHAGDHITGDGICAGSELLVGAKLHQVR